MTISTKSARLNAMIGQSGAALGIGLINQASKRSDIVAISADMSKPAGLGKFNKLFGERFFNVGIAEQNMVGIAAGLANEGYKPVVVAQACFLSMRSFEQVRQYSGYMNLPMVYVGVASGFALTSFGNTHYSLEDIAILRRVPNLLVVSPSDATQASQAIEEALTMTQSVYIRCTGIPNLKPIYTENYDFQIGKGNVLIDDGTDVVIFASGSVTRAAISAVERLRAEYDLGFKLVDMHTVQPIDKNLLKDSLIAKLWVSVEEHYVDGGLGSVLAEYLVENSVSTVIPRLHKIGVERDYTVPGDYDYLIEQNGLDSDSVYKNIVDKIGEINHVS